jgi:hypothetical protein
LAQTLAADVILGITAAVLVFGAPPVLGIIGGVGASIVMCARVGICRRTRTRRTE